MMYEREVDVPRLTGHYRLDPAADSTPPAILEAARRIVQYLDIPFNSVGLSGVLRLELEAFTGLNNPIDGCRRWRSPGPSKLPDCDKYAIPLPAKMRVVLPSQACLRAPELERCPSIPAHNAAHTRSSDCSAPAAWARSIVHETPSWAV